MKSKPDRVRWVGGSPPAVSRAPTRAHCASPFGHRVEPEAAHGILTASGLRSSLMGRAPGVLAAGFLPARAGGGCLFATVDGCAVEAALGRGGLPKACRSFPLVGVRLPDGSKILGVRRGGAGSASVGAVLAEFDAPPVGARHGLSSGRTLSWAETERVLAVWEACFGEPDPRVGLARAFAWTELVSARLEECAGDFEGALASPSPEVSLSPGVPFLARSFLAAAFSGGVSRTFEVDASPFRLSAFLQATPWILGFGRAGLPGGEPVSVGALRALESPLVGPHAARFAGYLREVLGRRELFVRQTYLGKGLIELAFALLVASWTARASAVRAGEGRCREADIDEALVVADAFLGAQLRGPSVAVLEQVRGRLLGDPRAFAAFVAAG